MKINSTNTPSANNNVIKWQKIYTKQSFNGTDLIKGNFDTFINNYYDDKKANASDLINKLKEVSEDDKKDIALDSYRAMQRIIGNAISSEAKKKEAFYSYKGEQEYLNDLLKSNDGDRITLQEGKYCFENLSAGVSVSRATVKECLERSKQGFQDLLNPPERDDNFPNDIVQRLFAMEASRFEEATGISCSAFDPYSDDTLLLRQTRTEESFIEESNKTIEKLKQRSESLAETMKTYLSKQDNNSNDIKTNKNIKAIQSIHEMLKSFGVLGLDFMGQIQK